LSRKDYKPIMFLLLTKSLEIKTLGFTMTEALISPEILRWARERAQLDLENLAKIAKVKPSKLMLWEKGEAKPTFNQAQHIAQVLHIPFGYLFLSNPPSEKLPIPDLRTIGDHPAERLSADLRDLLMDMLRKQDWYRDYLLEQGAKPLSFIGRFNLATDGKVIADDLTTTLGLTIKDREQSKNWEEFLTSLIDKAEDAGILVMRSGIVGSNTHRGLDVQEFRGTAICDDIAPLVFINGKDAKAAQIFTFMHELAHLWIGQSGISNLSLEQKADVSHHKIERLCNAVAAEVLVPKGAFIEHWSESDSLDENAAKLATFFRVSRIVVARRAFDMDLVDWSDYIDYYQRQAEIWRRKSKQEGGDPYRTIPVRNSKRLTVAVLQSVAENRMLFRDAGKLLGVNPSKIDRLAQEIGIW
jgi:Zn-dependent peptidase ImmA (M78 family)/DNA-binding XRE family transcriptional regulator